jgi:hypothetical protein
MGVTNIGHASDKTVATCVLTVGLTVPAGAIVLVASRENTVASAAATSVTDSKGNTYTAIATALGGSGGTSGPCTMWYSTLATALGAADTITYTKGGAVTDSATIAAGYATGLGVLDSAVTAINHATSTSLSVTSGVPAVAGETFFAFTAGGNTVSITADASWTTPPFDNYNASPGAAACMCGGYRVNAGTGALTITNTAASQSWGAVIVGFKPPVAGGSPTYNFNSPMLGL